MKARWISLSALAGETGFAVRTLQYIRAQEPGVLITRERGSKVEYKQPECSTNLFRREREIGKRDAKPANFGEARARKMEAEAREAELRVEERLGSVVPLATIGEVAGHIADRLLPVLQNVPSNYALRLEEVGVPPKAAERVLSAIALDLTTTLRDAVEGGNASEEEETEAEQDGDRDVA